MTQVQMTSAGHDIAYAYGRLGVLQQLLLSRSDVDRLLGAHDAKDVAMMFIELRLTSRIDQGITDPDEVLHAVARWVRDEVISMSPDGSLRAFDVLWLEGDIALAAYLLKKKLGMTSAISREPSPAFTAYGSAAWHELLGKTRSDDDQDSTFARAFVEEVLSQKNLTPAHIDTMAAQWGASEQLKAAYDSGSANILRFVQHAIDLQNIRTALRSLSLSNEERLALLISGGTISTTDLLGDRDQIASAIDHAELGYGVADEIRTSDLDNRQLEQSLSSVTAADIAQMWNIPLSQDPHFAFAALAFTQLKLLRTILLAKRAGFSPQETKRVLPPFLPATHYVL